jgi:hypothetical protein
MIEASATKDQEQIVQAGSVGSHYRVNGEAEVATISGVMLRSSVFNLDLFLVGKLA